MRRSLLPLLALLFALIGCDSAPLDETPVELAELTVTVRPQTAAPGQVRTFSLQAPDAGWTPNAVGIDLGPGVQPVGIQVRGADRLTLTAFVESDAALGPRDVVLNWDGREQVLDDGIVIEPGAIELSPDRAQLGENITVRVEGFGTALQQGASWASFDSDAIEVWDFRVESPTSAVMELVISPEAQPGLYDCFVYNGGEAYSLHGGFLLDRSWQGARVEPGEGYQGTTIPFSIYGEGTAFRDGFTEVELGSGIRVDLGEDPVEGLEYEITPGRIRGYLTIANAAPPGPRDVWVSTRDEAGEVVERVLIPDGFEVIYRAPDAARGRGSISITQSGTWDEVSCSWDYTTRATALFYEPLDPPCTAAPGTGVTTFRAPQRYDIVSFGYVAAPGAADCPTPQTFDVGPYVWFESPSHTIRLERALNSYTGRVTYAASGLTPEDYVPANSYDIRTEGADPDTPNGLPGFTVPSVLHTLPARYTMLEPDLCASGGLYDLDRPLDFAWTLTYTFDDASFYVRMTGPANDLGTPTLMAYPYDDGAFRIEPSVLDQWPAGISRAFAVANDYSYWQFPFNESTSAGFASSSISHRQELEFE